MKFTPLLDRVLVERTESDNKTAGGIIIPENAIEKPMEGRVAAVGSGNRDEAGKKIPLDVKAGDHLLFSKHAGVDVKIDGKQYVIMRESDILGIIS